MKIRVYRPAYEVWHMKSGNLVDYTTVDDAILWQIKDPSVSYWKDVDGSYLVEDIDGNRIGTARSLFGKVEQD